MNHHTDHSCCGCGSYANKRGEALGAWVRLRVASFVLIPLTFWLVYSIVSLVGADHAVFTAWLAAPVNATLLATFIAVACYHAALGVQEIIEDYISCEKTAHCVISLQKIAFTALAFVCLVSIIKVAL